MKTRNLYRIIIGALMIASGGYILLGSSHEVVVGAVLLVAGLAFLSTGISRHMTYGDDPESDERSRKIGAYGLSYGWLTGLFFMFALFWLDYAGILRLDTQSPLPFQLSSSPSRPGYSSSTFSEKGISGNPIVLTGADDADPD